MASIFRKLRTPNRPPKSGLLEKIENYAIYRDGTMFRVERDAAYLTYRTTQQDAHKAIAEDKARLATQAIKVVQQKAAA